MKQDGCDEQPLHLEPERPVGLGRWEPPDRSIAEGLAADASSHLFQHFGEKRALKISALAQEVAELAWPDLSSALELLRGQVQPRQSGLPSHER